jgi:ribokinase
LGADEPSRFVIETLQRERVNASYIAVQDGARPVTSSIIVDQSAGTRNIFYSSEGVIGAGPKHPPKQVIRSSRVLLVDRFGMPGMIRAAQIARAAGVAVVADLESSEVPQFDDLLRLVDHLIVSEEFALTLTRLHHPASAVAQLLSPDGREVVVVTSGARGAWFQQKGWRLPTFHPAFPVEVVDTTGCGDVFHGAYAAGLAQDLPLVERIRLASAAAAIKATRPGGQAGIPTAAEVKAFLQSQG